MLVIGQCNRTVKGQLTRHTCVSGQNCNCFFFFLGTLNVIVLINCNRTLYSPILSVIIIVINILDSCFLVIRFVNHLHDDRPN